MHAFFLQSFVRILTNFPAQGPLFDSWQGIGISRHLWQPDVSLQGAGGGVSTHCSTLLSRAAASTLLSTKKVQCRHQKSSFLWGSNIMNCSELFCHVLLCIFGLNLTTKCARWCKGSLSDIYTTVPYAYVSASSSSVARWQKFRPKSSKGATEKKSWPKEFVAEFWLILPKSGRKGAAENFQKKFLFFSCDNHV